MKTRRILSFILTLTMLLTLFSGEFASAAGMKIVTAGEELAYDPLAETASVAYEQHDAGYAVSLDRAADSVTMRVTAVPGSRGADKAKLFVRTGVALKAGTTYRVSFALASEQKLADYTVNFDGDTSAAYGKLDKRSVEAGGTDRVEYTLTPKAASGELTLRLLLGKTEVNTLRFSDLAVEEAPAEQSGANKLLVDKLNYAAPGAIRCAAEAGYSAEMTSTDTSATMSITNVPSKDAAVWKLKLMVATGLKPEPGKTYRFRATLNSSNSGSYEACYNEGEVEKGYDVLYNQTLKKGTQTIDRRIYVPTDRENPGELIVQFSLGKLSVGDQVTISKVSVEEATAKYTNALPKDFALNGSYGTTTIYKDEMMVTGATEIATNMDWNGVCVTASGNRAGELTVDKENNTAALVVGANSDNEDGVWEACLNIDTGLKLTAGKIYSVKFTIGATENYDGDDRNYEVKYGTVANDGAYGTLYGCKLSDAEKIGKEVSYMLRPDSTGGLVIKLQLGRTGGIENTVTVSNLSVRICTLGDNIANAGYSGTNSSFKVRSDNYGSISAGDGSSATMLNKGNEHSYEREMVIVHVCDLEDNIPYQVSFNILTTASSADAKYKIHLNRGVNDGDNAWSGDDGAFGEVDWQTFDGHEKVSKTTKENATGGRLNIIIELDNVFEGETVTVSDISVAKEDGTPVDLTMNYPGGSFHVNEETAGDEDKHAFRNGKVEHDNNGGVKVTSWSDPTTASGGDAWMRRLFIDNIAPLEAHSVYQVSFDIKADKAFSYEACLNMDWGKNHWVGGEGRFGKLFLTTRTNAFDTVTCLVRTDWADPLLLMLNIGAATDDTHIWIKNIKVQKVNDPSGSNLVGSFGNSVWTEMYSPYEGYVTRDSAHNSATYTVTEVPERGDRWQGYNAKLLVDTGVEYQANKNYRVKFNLKAQNAVGEFVVITKGVSDNADIRGTWGLSIAGGNKETPFTTRAIPAGMGTGKLAIQLELGKLNGPNEFTISDVRVEEVGLKRVVDEDRDSDVVYFDTQDNYLAQITHAKDSATLNIKKTPAAAADREAWKNKLFIDTGISPSAGESYRVCMDVTAENDMDFEVCYNRGNLEKGFDAMFDLHASAGKAKRVEKVINAENTGRLIVQLSLGKVAAPNKVTVSNLRVERVKYSYSGKSALPAEISYQAGDVSYWAHADYDARFTNTADAVTAHITPPAKNPEPWKVKLFLDTGVALQGGKYYKVTTDVSAKKSQNYEICYNNGGVEFGYDSMGGLKVAGGKTERIEKLISVPAGKKDTNNLMLQFNLGKTSIANEVTIGGVTVEEVTLAYADALGKDFSYQKSLSTWTDPKTTYKASVDSAADAATLHISGVPASGTGVWMVKLFVHTGAMLEAGKSYQVSADLLAAKAQDFETCFNNEETEKGFDAIYGQKFAAGVKTTVDKRISVPASMTDAGELVLQFSVGGAVANDITVSNVSVQELQYGGSGDASPVPDTVIALDQSAQAAGTLDVTRDKLTYRMTKIAADAKDNAIRIAGADLRSGDLYAVAFTAKTSKELTGTLALAPSGGKSAVISKPFTLTTTEQTYSFTTAEALAEGGAYDIFWQFGSADNQKLGSADVELSDISVSVPAERLEVVRSVQKVTVNGKAVSPDIYNINGSNYFKLRDLAVLLNGTNGQFVVRYNPQTNGVSLTTDKAYTPIGGELTIGTDKSTTCVRSPQNVSINGKEVKLKAYNIGGNNFFKLRDLGKLLNFQVDYIAATNTVLIASPLTPERQEASYAYNVFFRPEIDGESQPYVGDTMPFYDNGTYYIYYLKEGGDSYNHSVYLTTTRDFVSYQEYDTPVLSASRADVQDSWIGTGSVVKVDRDYYFFYTGFNASGSQEYHEKIMVAKGSSPTSFTKVGGWSITPPAELNQKNDFRDPQAYYDPATGTISLTVTASKDGTARILKYTLGKDLSSVKYDGIIFTDPTGAFYNLECSDTFRLGNKWYLTYSGQEDTLWYASADSRFGPYSAPKRMDGTIFYAAKHVENGKNSYMVGWTRRSASASSTDEVSGWGGNLAVQQLRQNADGSLSMIPADSIASAFSKSVASSATSATLTAGSGYSYKKAFTSSESFKLTGEFTCAGTGSLGLAFDFDGTEDQYKLISVDPAEGKLKLLFNGGATQIAETQAKVAANQKHTFTYIQDGSVGIFYLDGQAALTVRLYGVTDKPIYLFAENNSVTFTSLRQFTR